MFVERSTLATAVNVIHVKQVAICCLNRNYLPEITGHPDQQRAEVVKVVEDEIKDGRRQTIGFKVIDSKIGNIVASATGGA